MNLPFARILLPFILPLLWCLCSCGNKVPESGTAYAGADHSRAWKFYQQGQPDSAFFYYAKAAAGTKDSSVLAGIYITMAIIQSDKGDYFGSEETAVKSLQYFRAGDPYLPAVYNTIAINKYKLKDFASAVTWYRRAVTGTADPLNRLYYESNLGVTLTEMGKYDTAIVVFRKVMDAPLIRKRPEKYAQALDNYAWARSKRYPAEALSPLLLKALSIRLKLKDEWGQNASYAHLSDHFGQREPVRALAYARLMYGVAAKLQSPDDRLEALQKLVRLSPEKESRFYFGVYTRLQDSLWLARSAARNQFAVIRYEAVKAKADNLNLQKNNTEQRFRLLRQQFILYGLLVIIAVSAVLIMGFIRRRQARLRREAAERLRAQQLRTAKRVHDVLANDLYRIMSDLDNGTAGDPAELADRLEVLYERARDLSYEDEPVPLAHFELHLAAMLVSFGTERTRVLPDNCTKAFWEGTTDVVRQEVSLVLQELMVNMRKHSGATLVTVAFQRSGKACLVIYTDNGMGMPATSRKGNGISHTENRMSAIGGNIIFETGRENGLQVQLSFSAA
ncbi:hypothetical protein D0C36_15835 [Mucilaginibacter conchicola]|uniref:histidine kinase n=1 Tax=Mucilaginibacter conchicola TaxID=2303333 RepID=A0A372NV91_9SPHI|nr:hypothetical protein [Mucilaginibacter conchicola]RFZ92861.1 hypothetical protein D0C36_15835 [Mucilaginibacter conchicola]